MKSFLAFLMMAYTLGGHAEEITEISGMVYDVNTGVPLGGADVFIQGAPEVYTTDDKTGYFQLIYTHDRGAGNALLRVVKEEYRPSKEEISTESSGVDRLEVALYPIETRVKQVADKLRSSDEVCHSRVFLIEVIGTLAAKDSSLRALAENALLDVATDSTTYSRFEALAANACFKKLASSSASHCGNLFGVVESDLDEIVDETISSSGLRLTEQEEFSIREIFTTSLCDRAGPSATKNLKLTTQALLMVRQIVSARGR